MSSPLFAPGCSAVVIALGFGGGGWIHGRRSSARHVHTYVFLLAQLNTRGFRICLSRPKLRRRRTTSRFHWTRLPFVLFAYQVAATMCLSA